MTIRQVLLFATLAWASTASAGDIIARSTSVVEHLFIALLHLTNVVTSVETEFVPHGAGIMRTTVVVRHGPSYQSKAVLLRVLLDFVGDTVVFISAKGAAIDSAVSLPPS
jgi:uncharacterized membrane protein